MESGAGQSSKRGMGPRPEGKVEPGSFVVLVLE